MDNTQLQKFNFNGWEVKVLIIDDQAWFVGGGVAAILGYSNTSKAILDHVDDDDKKILKSQNGTFKNIPNRGIQIINESGLYSLILSSKLPNAKAFKRWVTSEVLPSIRKHGAYLTDQKAAAIVTDQSSLADLLQQAADQLKRKDIKIERLQEENDAMKPKALFADAVSVSKTPILVGELAKILKQNGIEIGQNRLFEWLRANGYLVNRKGTDYNMPSQRSMDQGLFIIKETPIFHSDGHTTISKTPKVTGKGQIYFVNKFLGK